MRIKLPVSQREYDFPAEELLMHRVRALAQSSAAAAREIRARTGTSNAQAAQAAGPMREAHHAIAQVVQSVEQVNALPGHGRKILSL